MGIKTACQDKLKVYRPSTRNSIPTLGSEVTGDTAHYVHLAFVFRPKFRRNKMPSGAVMREPRHSAPGIRQCPVLRHKTRAGIPGSSWGNKRALGRAGHRYPGNAAQPRLGPKPWLIFVGSGPNGAVVVTGCKCGDFVPRHAECFKLSKRIPPHSP